jgi:hypothetical protein
MKRTAPDLLPVTRRLIALLLPLDAADLAIALGARWAGLADHIVLYLLAFLVLLLTVLVAMVHMLDRGRRVARVKGHRDNLQAVLLDMSGIRGHLDPKAVLLLAASAAAVLYAANRGAVTGATTLLMSTLFSAMVLLAVTRRWPVDESQADAK